MKDFRNKANSLKSHESDSYKMTRNSIVLFLFILLMIIMYWPEEPDINSKNESKPSSKTNNQILSNSKLKPKEPRELASSTVQLEDLQPTAPNDPYEGNCWEDTFESVSDNTRFIENNSKTLNELVGPWFYNSNTSDILPDTEPSVAGLFYLAMAKSNLMIGLNSRKQKDVTQSLAILNQIHKLDPENSAPLLFAASIEAKRGNIKRSDSLIEQAIEQTSAFDTYESMFIHKLLNLVQDPQDLKSAIMIRSVLPIVDVSALKKLLTKKEHAKLAHQMIKSALDKSHRFEDNDFSESLSYAVADLILKDLGDKTVRPSAGELLRESLESYTCHKDSFNEYFDKVRSAQTR